MSEETFHIFLTRAFKGIAKICLKKGVRYQEALESLKSAFIEASIEEISTEKQEQTSNITTSRISAMTGLQRKDISRINQGAAPGSESISLITKIVGAWTTHKLYSKKGKPRVLTCIGAGNEFQSLVYLVSKDLNFNTVLAELERINMISRQEDKVSLIFDNLKVTNDEESSLNLLSRDILDLTRTVQGNTFQTADIPNLHVTTRYDNICTSKLGEIKIWFLKEGAELHRRVREYVSNFDKDLNPSLYDQEGGGKIVFSSFSCVDNEAEIQLDNKLDSKSKVSK